MISLGTIQSPLSQEGRESITMVEDLIGVGEVPMMKSMPIMETRPSTKSNIMPEINVTIQMMVTTITTIKRINTGTAIISITMTIITAKGSVMTSAKITVMISSENHVKIENNN